MLYREMTPEEVTVMQRAAIDLLTVYDRALVDPNVTMPSYLHAALMVLRSSLETK